MTTSLLFSSSSHVIPLYIWVDDVDWQGRYDHLEVWRSINGEDGVYDELSGPYWTPASLPGTLAVDVGGTGPHVNVVGKELEVVLNDQLDLSVTFTGTDPLTFRQVANQISAALGRYVTALVSVDGLLYLVAKSAGALSSLRVLPGDGATLLGLVAGVPAFGSDPRLPLVLGKNSYNFTDYYGDKGNFYKTRFRNSLTRVVSEFSEPISPKDNSVIDPALIVMGFVRAVQHNGRPDSRVEVLVYNSYATQRIGDSVVTGGEQRLLTDDNGYVEFPLLRGLIMDVSIGGTALIRRVTTPTDPTVLKFDVFDPAYGADDNFAVQRAVLPYAERSS